MGFYISARFPINHIVTLGHFGPMAGIKIRAKKPHLVSVPRNPWQLLVMEGCSGPMLWVSLRQSLAEKENKSQSEWRVAAHWTAMDCIALSAGSGSGSCHWCHGRVQVRSWIGPCRSPLFTYVHMYLRMRPD